MLRWPAAIVEMDYVVVVVGWRGCDPVVRCERRDRIALDAVNPGGTKVNWNAAAERVRPNASPDAVSGFQNHHAFEAIGAQLRRGGQTCDASADDNHSFTTSRVRLAAAKAATRHCGCCRAESGRSEPVSQCGATA